MRLRDRQEIVGKRVRNQRGHIGVVTRDINYQKAEVAFEVYGLVECNKTHLTILPPEKEVVPARRPKVKGWWEEYRCGCVSETVARKKDLLGYCGKHGENRRQVFPELPRRHGKDTNAAA